MIDIVTTNMQIDGAETERLLTINFWDKQTQCKTEKRHTALITIKAGWSVVWKVQSFLGKHFNINLKRKVF